MEHEGILHIVMIPRSIPDERVAHKVLHSREHPGQCKAIIASHSRVCGRNDKPRELFLVNQAQSILCLFPFVLMDLWLSPCVLVLCGTHCYVAATGRVLSWDGGCRGRGDS